MWIEFVAFVFLILILTILFWRSIGTEKHDLKGFPPGPNLISTLETFLPVVISSPLKRIQKWRHDYGEIVGVNYGDSYVVVLHGYNLIKEAFSDTKFNGRVPAISNEAGVGTHGRGLTISEGKTWSEQRKFTLKNLRDLGVGKQTLESMIHEEISELTNTLKQSLSKPINLYEQLNLVVLNALWHLICGSRFLLDDPNLNSLAIGLSQLSNATSRKTFGRFPLTKQNLINKFISRLRGRKHSENTILLAKDALQRQIDGHKQTFEDDNMRDFIDLYIREIHDARDKDSSFYQQVGDENILHTILNILTGGIEPTSNILNAGLYFLSRNLTVQKKLQDEIDFVVGHFHPSSLNDRQKMPYTEAAILEILRISSVILSPFGIPHCVIDDAKFHDYNIPKGTIVVGNLHDLHHNETVWKDPSLFNPERFLNKMNEIDKDHQPIAAFGVGKRSCPGETFAKDVAFLVLTSLFQRFHVLPDSKSVKNSASDLNPTTLLKFKAVFEDRLEFLNRALDE